MGEEGLQVELVRGGGGVFDVTLGEELLFSRHRQGRFPEPGEILTMLRARRGSNSASGES